MLILLDIDGVMVHAKPWSPPPAMDDGFYIFNSNAVAALNQIIGNSNAEIVLTTSHKHSFSLTQWLNIFKNRGVDVSRISRLKLNQDNLNRHDEIVNWFSTSSNVHDFVIIDDDKSLNGLTPILKSRLIQTKPLVGLNRSHVKDAIRILATPLEWV